MAGASHEVTYKGDALTAAERQKAVAQLARLTGLSPAFIERSDLRIEIQRFCKELLREKGLTVGRLDGRLTGSSEGAAVAERPEFDPSLTAMRLRTRAQVAKRDCRHEVVSCTWTW